MKTNEDKWIDKSIFTIKIFIEKMTNSCELRFDVNRSLYLKLPNSVEF